MEFGEVSLSGGVYALLDLSKSQNYLANFFQSSRLKIKKKMKYLLKLHL